MAGEDKDFIGEAWAGRGRQGRLSCRRSRSSTPTKDVLGNVEEGVGETRAARPLRRGQRRSSASDPDADDGQAARRAGRAAGQDRRRQRLGARPHARDRDGRAALPAGRRRRRPSSPAASAAAWRCAGCCCSKPDMLLLDEPTNHLDAESVAWLERTSQEYPGTVVAVTHDRYFLDNVAGWILELDRGHGIPWEGNYSSWLEQKEQAARPRGEDRTSARQRTLAARARMGAAVARGPPGQEQGPPHRLRGAARRGRRERDARHDRDPHPAGPAPRRPRDRGREAHARATATGC